jgi:hypothetical protein
MKITIPPSLIGLSIQMKRLKGDLILKNKREVVLTRIYQLQKVSLSVLTVLPMSLIRVLQGLQVWVQVEIINNKL